MEPVYFILAIMGCGDGEATCQQVRTEPARYQSAAQCRAAMPGALQRSTDVDFPVVSAACRASGPVMVRAGRERPRG